MPPEPSGIVFFCEVQFQLDKLLYERMMSEISIYAYRHRERFFDWQAVVIYPSRSVEQSRLELVREFLASGRILPVYLDELGTGSELPIGLGLMVLTTLEGELIGEARGEARMILRLPSRRFGEVPDSVSGQIQQLTVPQLEDLGEALLDFTSLADVEGWLSRNLR